MEDVAGVPGCMGICADATSGTRTESRPSSRIGYDQKNVRIIRSMVDGDERWLESVLTQPRVAAAPYLLIFFQYDSCGSSSSSEPRACHVSLRTSFRASPRLYRKQSAPRDDYLFLESSLQETPGLCETGSRKMLDLLKTYTGLPQKGLHHLVLPQQTLLVCSTIFTPLAG